MKKRQATIQRKTKETSIKADLTIDGSGENEISTGIPFFDHMLTLFTVHGFFDLFLEARGDIEVDFHHTVEDIGLVLGKALDQALGTRKGIMRYGHAVTPMDEALSMVTIDLSKRPFLVYNIPPEVVTAGPFDVQLASEFFRAFANKGGMNLHISVQYGINQHHVIESVFKSLGRSLDQAVTINPKVKDYLSTKGSI